MEREARHPGSTPKDGSESSRRPVRRRELVLLALAAAAFLLVACWHLELPGLQYDECLAAAPAVNFVQGTERAEPMQIRPSVIRLWGRPLPLMVMSYIGPVKTLAHAPFFAALGISPRTVRLMPVLAILASLLLAWWLARRLWGPRVAALTAVLVALDPSWVFYLSRDVGPAALAVLLKLAALGLGLGWWSRGRSRSGRWYLAGSALCLGLGVSHKVDFLWVVAALLVPLAVLAGRQTRCRLDRRGVILALSAFLVGAAPVVAFNLVTGGHTFSPFLEDLLTGGRPEQPGGLGAALGTRLEQLAGLSSGGVVQALFSGGGGGLPGGSGTLRTVPGGGAGWLRILPALTWSGASVWLLGAWLGDRRGRRLELTLLLHAGVVLGASCFSPTALNPHHLLTLYPVFQLMVAVALADAVRWGRRTGRTGSAQAAVLLAVALVVTANLASVSAIQRALRTTGGTGYWSDAIYQLAQDLEERFLAPGRSGAGALSGERLRIMDWGFTNNLIVLTEGRLPMEPVYRQLWRRPASVALFLAEVDPDARYLFHASAFSLYDRVPELFAAAAARRDLVPVVEERYHQRDGREVYRLVRLVASPSGVSRKARGGPTEDGDGS